MNDSPRRRIRKRLEFRDNLLAFIIGIVVLALWCTFLAYPFVKDRHDHSPYKSYETYHKKEYECPNCHGTDTSGFGTFYNSDDKIIAGNNLDYQKEHCSYTTMYCSTCGERFKLYKRDW